MNSWFVVQADDGQFSVRYTARDAQGVLVGMGAFGEQAHAELELSRMKARMRQSDAIESDRRTGP